MGPDSTQRTGSDPWEVAARTGRLDLSNQGLTVLPPEIGGVAHLRELSLVNNSIRSLPPEIGNLSRLRVLDVSGNRLTSLPDSIGTMTSLRQLRLNRNMFTEVPVEVYQLTNLAELSLCDNRLDVLSPELARLVGLRLLDIKRNDLKELPREFSELLDGGLHIGLDGNPLNEPLLEISRRGDSAIGTYLRSIVDGEPQYEAKALLLGEGNVGKTSLIAALLGEEFIFDRETTHGIEIRPMSLTRKSDGQAMAVRAWDFGGQLVYRITHQFFFSRRSLYVVVWNAREGYELNDVEGWLRRVRLRVGAEVPTLIVATHCSERSPDLDYPNLVRAFPLMLRGKFEVDNKDGTGIDLLRNAIADHVAQLPQIGEILSSRWIAARDDIRRRAELEPQISYEDFTVICRRRGVVGDEVNALAELLHDLGQIIYYGENDGLRDLVVLNPEWLTKAIGRVLEDRPTIDAKGVLDHRRLKEIWGSSQEGPGYPQRYHPYFLRLMERFDLSYRIGEDERRSLVAQLVPHERPRIPWDFGGSSSAEIRTLALSCTMAEPAPGLIPWITVRHYRSSIGRHWRRGVFLRHPVDAYQSEALVELFTPTELMIEVRAPSPDLFFNVLVDSVGDLLSRWPGLDYQMRVPCPTRFENGGRCNGRFPLRGLQGLRERGKSDIPCMQCLTTYEVSALLTGFTMPSEPLKPQLEQLRAELKEIGQHVVQAEKYAAQTADSVRRVIKAVSLEVTDCPRLFTLTTAPTSLLKVYRDRYRMVLWCEHPSEWHPWPAATYQFDQPKAWIGEVAPYAELVFKALRLVVLVTAPLAGVAFDSRMTERAKSEVELMKVVVDKLPGANPAQPTRGLGPMDGQLSVAEGAAARAMRALLFKIDNRKEFGGLRRVLAESGDYLWVCPNHYSTYDRGLPKISNES